MWKTDMTNQMTMANLMLFVIVLLLQMIDIITTAIAIPVGAVETNPLVAWSIHTFGTIYGLIGLKVLVLIYVMIAIRKHLHLASLTISLSLIIFVYAYAMFLCNIPKVFELMYPHLLPIYLNILPPLVGLEFIFTLFYLSIILCLFINNYKKMQKYGASYFFRPIDPPRIPKSFIKKKLSYLILN